jgi:hypothetical protein
MPGILLTFTLRDGALLVDLVDEAEFLGLLGT